MQDHGDGAPSWLFSFLDLALLMLIAMTQLAPDTPPEVPDLGQMVVPRIGEAGSDALASESVEVWQLRVHPPEEGMASPYELVHVVDGQPMDEGQRIESASLRVELAGLKSAQTPNDGGSARNRFSEGVAYELPPPNISRPFDWTKSDG